MHSECFDANPVHRKNEIEIYCKTRKELSHPPSPKYFFHQNTYRNNQQEKKFQTKFNKISFWQFKIFYQIFFFNSMCIYVFQLNSSLIIPT
jgi:hypothetical protein